MKIVLLLLCIASIISISFGQYMHCQSNQPDNISNCTILSSIIIKACNNQSFHYQDPFQVMLCLSTSSGKQELEIVVTNQDTFQSYFLLIDQSYFNTNSIMQTVYVSTSNLYTEMSTNFDNYTVTINGEITVTVYINKRPQNLIFPTEKIEITQIQILNRKFNNLVIDVQEQAYLTSQLTNLVKQENLLLKEQQAKLKQNYTNLLAIITTKFEEMNNRISILQTQNKDQKQQIVTLQQLISNITSNYTSNTSITCCNTTTQLKDDIIVITNNLSSIRNTLDDLSAKDSQLSKSLNDTIIQVDILQEDFSQFKKINNFYNNTIVNQNKKYFQITKLEDKTIVKYTQNLIEYGYFHAVAIQNGKVNRFYVLQKKTKDKNVKYGVAVGASLGQLNPHRNIDAKMYSSLSGSIWQNGIQVKRLLQKAIDGDIVTIVADTINWNIRWEINRKTIATTPFEESMKYKQIYFVIGMISKDNEIEILTL